MGARYAQDRDEARSIVLGLIPEGATVGMGDSVTFLQAGITQEIEKRWGDRVFNPFHVGPEGIYALSGRDPINLMGRPHLPMSSSPV